MDIWKQKLQLAESIAEHKFTDAQAEVFVEDERDLSLFFFNPKEGQTTVGITYALVNAYWKPNSKYLYINEDIKSMKASKIIADLLTKNFKKCRPERTYQTLEGNVSIAFDETISNVKFHTLNENYIGQDYDAIILDTSYQGLKTKHIVKFTNIIAQSGKLMIMSQSGDEIKLSNTKNKLDAMLDDIIIESTNTNNRISD